MFALMERSMVGDGNRIAFRSNGYALSRDLTPQLVRLELLKPLGREARTHPAAQIRKLVASLEQFGFVLPIVVDGGLRVVAGWAVVQAAMKMGLLEIPAISVTDLDEAKLRLLRLALNRLGEDSRWAPNAPALEFADIFEIDSTSNFSLSGFEMGEIDVALSNSLADEEDDLPVVEAAAITKPGDLWLLGDHRLLCADALQPESYARLLLNEKAQIIFCDPPWNIRIEGHVSGLGFVKHKDFAMACGEMTNAEFTSFLRSALGYAAEHSIDGSIHFVCMGWSKMGDLLAATPDLYAQLLNVCAWVKPNGGMGKLYRSRHEFVFVFKRGTAPHTNNIELGRFGRNRTNVWEYASQNVMNGTAKSKLSLHPTPKPVAMVADAIRDCSNRNGIILDPFGGIGSTLIAAQKTGRKARLIEIDPRYVDATIKRWMNVTGEVPVNADTGAAFAATPEIAAQQPMDSAMPNLGTGS
jgi:DNA modification methylase